MTDRATAAIDSLDAHARRVLDDLTADERDATLRMYEQWTREQRWHALARTKQLPPPPPWFVWLILAGRGFGKTLTGAEWVADKLRKHPGCRVALVAGTFADGRDTMVEGETGLLSVLDPSELRDGSLDRGWNRSLGEVLMRNGSRAKVYTSERPKQLRGPQHHFAWGDEPAKWEDARKGTTRDTTYSNMTLGLRLKRPVGRRGAVWPADYRPQALLTGTPAPVALLRGKPTETETGERILENPGLLDLAGETDARIVNYTPPPGAVLVVRGSTFENIDNLAETYRANVIDPLVGTRLGQQELEAAILDDVEGALWSLDLVARATWRADLPPLVRTVVAVDASGSETGDECGVIGVSLTRSRSVIVRADRTRRGPVSKRYAAVADLAIELGAGEIVYEGNYGGDNIKANIANALAEAARDGRLVGPPPRVVSVSARGTKADRAMTVVPLFETGRAWLAQGLPLLADELTSWVPGESGWSPNRLDAMVHGIRRLAPRLNVGGGGVRTADGQVQARTVGRAQAPDARPVGRRGSGVRTPDI